MTRADLKGVYTASVTPVNRDRTLDAGAMRALIEYYIDSGIKGALLPSSSGEYFSMTADMKRLCVSESVKAANGKFQVLANISDHCPEVVLQNARAMAALGADALVCQPPQFHGYSQEEAVTFFHYIADNSPLPIIVYNHLVALPTKLAVESVIKICSHENIIGVKDTHRDFERPAILKAAMEEAGLDFSVMFGGELVAATGSLLGFDLLNALSAVRPDIMTELWKAGQAGDTQKALALQEKVNKLVKLFSCLRGGTSSISLFSMALKIALERKGLCGTTSVILGFEADDADRAAVEAVLASVDE